MEEALDLSFDRLLMMMIVHRQYTTYIKQDAIITKLGYIWLHVSAVIGHHQAD